MPSATMTGPAPPHPLVLDIALCTVRMWAAIRARHPGVPDVALHYVAHYPPNTGGHIAAGAWRTSTVKIGPSMLRLRADAALGVLLHTAAHGLAYTEGDTRAVYCATPQHPARYEDYATQVGLRWQRDRYGRLNTWPDGPAAWDVYSPELVALGDALTAYQYALL